MSTQQRPRRSAGLRPNPVGILGWFLVGVIAGQRIYAAGPDWILEAVAWALVIGNLTAVLLTARNVR